MGPASYRWRYKNYGLSTWLVFTTVSIFDGPVKLTIVSEPKTILVEFSLNDRLKYGIWNPIDLIRHAVSNKIFVSWTPAYSDSDLQPAELSPRHMWRFKTLLIYRLFFMLMSLMCLKPILKPCFSSNSVVLISSIIWSL